MRRIAYSVQLNLFERLGQSPKRTARRIRFVDYGGQQHFAEDHGIIEIEYMIPTTNAGTSYETQLFLCAGDIKAPAAEAAVTGTLIADGQYHTLQISVKDLDFWQGLIHMIRFDYFSSSSANDVVFVKAFRLVTN